MSCCCANYHWAVNDQVTIPWSNMQQRQIQTKFPIVRPTCPELKRNSIEINTNMFSPEEELLNFDWDVNSLSRKSVNSSSSLTNEVQTHSSNCSPLADVSISVTEDSPAFGVSLIARTPSTKGNTIVCISFVKFKLLSCCTYSS